LKSVHGAPFSAEPAALAGLGIGLHKVIRGSQPLRVLEDMEGFQEETAAATAVTDSVYSILPVGHSVDQSFFGASLQDVFGLLARYFTPHTVLYCISPKSTEVKADFSGMLAVGEVWIKVLAVLAGTV
jgi:hypothetical protein